jgi:glycosyltransferase involved in cell wall biosynthesis
MLVGMAVHGWYHPLAETDTYISSLEKALDSVNIDHFRIRGHKLPHGKISQIISASVSRYFMRYDPLRFDLVHDTRGDSVSRNVDVSTIPDLYWYQHKNDLKDRLLQLPIKIFEDYGRTLRLSKRVVVINPVIKKEFEQFFGPKYSEKIKVIPFPVEPMDFYGRHDKKYDVIWVGSTDKRKRLPLFLQSLVNLPKDYRVGIRVNYLSPYISDKQKLIKNLITVAQNDDRKIEIIQFNKLWDSMKDLYLSAKCLVSTSHYEGFQAPVAEAYLSGTRVVLPRNELFMSIYGDAEGVHYYNGKEELPSKIIEAVEQGKFSPDQKIINYLGFKNVGNLLRETYEESMPY